MCSISDFFTIGDLHLLEIRGEVVFDQQRLNSLVNGARTSETCHIFTRRPETSAKTFHNRLSMVVVVTSAKD